MGASFAPVGKTAGTFRWSLDEVCGRRRRSYTKSGASARRQPAKPEGQSSGLRLKRLRLRLFGGPFEVQHGLDKGLPAGLWGLVKRGEVLGFVHQTHRLIYGFVQTGVDFRRMPVLCDIGLLLPQHLRIRRQPTLPATPTISQGLIGTCLGRPQSTISDWIKDLRAKENQKRHWNIESLGRLGWTQAEIGEATGLSRSRVSEAMSEIPYSAKSTKASLAQGHDIADVAQNSGMSLQLATAMSLDSTRDDGERAKKLSVNIRPHDAWMFNGFRDLFGRDDYGRISRRRRRGGKRRGVKKGGTPAGRDVQNTSQWLVIN